jgi:hypothetical protein
MNYFSKLAIDVLQNIDPKTKEQYELNIQFTNELLEMETVYGKLINHPNEELTKILNIFGRIFVHESWVPQSTIIFKMNNLYYYITAYSRNSDSPKKLHKSGIIDEKYIKILRDFMRKKQEFLLKFIAYEIEDFFNIIDTIWRGQQHFVKEIIKPLNYVYIFGQSIGNTIKELQKLKYIVNDASSPNKSYLVPKKPAKLITEPLVEINPLQISCIYISLSAIFQNRYPHSFIEKFKLTRPEFVLLENSFIKLYYENIPLVEGSLRGILEKINTLDTINNYRDEYTLENLYYEYLVSTFFDSFASYHKVQDFLLSIPPEIEVILYEPTMYYGPYRGNYEAINRYNFITKFAKSNGLFNIDYKILKYHDIMELRNENLRLNKYTLEVSTFNEDILPHRINPHNITISSMFVPFNLSQQFNINEDNTLTPIFDDRGYLNERRMPKKSQHDLFDLLFNIFNTIKENYNSNYTVNIIGKVWFDIECDKHEFIVPNIKGLCNDLSFMYINTCKLMSIRENNKSTYCGNYNLNKYKVYTEYYRINRNFCMNGYPVHRDGIDLPQYNDLQNQADRNTITRDMKREEILLNILDNIKKDPAAYIEENLSDSPYFTPIDNFYGKKSDVVHYSNSSSSKDLSLDGGYKVMYMQYKRKYLDAKKTIY